MDQLPVDAGQGLLVNGNKEKVTKVGGCSVRGAVRPNGAGGDGGCNQRFERRDGNLDGWHNVGADRGGVSTGRAWRGQWALLVEAIPCVVDAPLDVADELNVRGDLVALVALDSVEDKAAASGWLRTGAGWPGKAVVGGLRVGGNVVVQAVVPVCGSCC